MKENRRAKNKDKRMQEPFFNYRNGSIIKQNGKEVFLEYRLKDFFTILHDNQNNVVTRDEIMNFVWKDVIVSDESITKAASDLRKFFKSNNITEIKLITIHKLGYKLEIIESELPNNDKTNFFIRSLKLIGYVLLTFLLIIIIIRAINY